MRKIKFRAWDEKVKRMFDVDVLAISPVMWDSGGTGVSLAYQPHIKVMQYTGLKDKNGKEIYEGDIVECFVNGNSYVSFKGGAYGLIFDYSFIPFSDVHGEMKVIGNIYEDKHLLDGDK